MNTYTDRQYAKYTTCPKSQWWTNVRLTVLVVACSLALVGALLFNMYM